MNFEVLGNNGDYRGTRHPYKISFMWTTYMKTSEQIPNLSRFNLSPFSRYFISGIPWFYVGCKGCCGKATPYFNPVTEEIEANKYACDSCEKDETITSIR
ncbi:hypothetical protein YC2023_085102 [Brassica napus]|nr:unnamed protein product [Brassica napus]